MRSTYFIFKTSFCKHFFKRFRTASLYIEHSGLGLNWICCFHHDRRFELNKIAVISVISSILLACSYFICNSGPPAIDQVYTEEDCVWVAIIMQRYLYCLSLQKAVVEHNFRLEATEISYCIDALKSSCVWRLVLLKVCRH